MYVFANYKFANHKKAWIQKSQIEKMPHLQNVRKVPHLRKALISMSILKIFLSDIYQTQCQSSFVDLSKTSWDFYKKPLSCMRVQKMKDDKDAGVLCIVVDEGPVELPFLVILPALLLLQNL